MQKRRLAAIILACHSNGQRTTGRCTDIVDYVKQMRTFPYRAFDLCKYMINPLSLFFLISLLISFCAVSVHAQQETEIGLPLIKHFSTDDYMGHGQNWSITQDKEGVMYFGNTIGVLEYDGFTWRLIPFPSIVRSVASDNSGRIFVGAQGDFGYLKADSVGANQFVSLLSYLPDSNRNFTNVWKTYTTREGVYYCTLSHIFLLKNDTIQTWMAGDASFGWSFLVRDTLYVQKRGVGIFKMIEGELQLVPATEQVAQHSIYFIEAYKSTQLLIGTRARGLEIYHNGRLSKFNTELDVFLQNNNIYSIHNLSDSSIAVGTDGGVAIINEEGKLMKLITEKNGLPDKGILSFYSDHQDHLWIGLQNGIARFDWPSPITLFGPESGIERHVEVVLRHQGIIYVAGRSGLYYLDPLSVEQGEILGSQFKLLPELENVSCNTLLPIGERLLIGTINGIYELSNHRLRHISHEDSAITCFYHSRKEPDRIYAGGPNVFASFILTDGQWINEGDIQGITSEIRPILEQDDGQLWLGTRYGGPYRVNFSAGFTTTPPVEQFDKGYGLPEGDVYVFSIKDKTVFATDSGLYGFDEQRRKFLPDTSLGVRFAGKAGGKEVFRLSEDFNNDIWVATSPHFGVQRLQPDGTLRWETSPFMKIEPHIYAIFPEKNNIIWLASNKGIYRYDQKKHKEDSSLFYALIRNVSINSDSIIFNGHYPASKSERSVPQLAYNSNEVRIDFSSTDFSDENEIMYQYKLEDFDAAWSTWTTDHRKEYTNLPGGDYRFRVRAKNIYGQLSVEGQYSFSILFPWWKTWWSYGIYSVMILLIVGRLSVIYARYRIKEHARKLAREQKINKRLRQVDQLKDQFLANTSHELRTPLQGIIGLSESLYERENEKIKKNELAMITSSGKRLSSLVNSILDFSKLKTHELTLSIKALDLRTITDVVIQISVPLVKGKSVLLINEIDPAIPLVEADEERVYQVMHNLIGNAIKFTNEGEITITASVQAEKVQVCVKDTGIGIPEDQLDTIFESFEQIDASITRKYGGTGLGLTISKQLVELHGGEIWIESQIDKGTSVYFTLPKSKADKSSIKDIQALSKVAQLAELDLAKTEHDLANKQASSNSRFRILIVDDEPINQQVLSNHLSDSNFQILQAMSGMEALNVLDNTKLDLVLLDIMMPKISGYEVCKEIRKKYLPSELPVIMITAKDQVSDLVEGLACGANDYLSKPFTKAELLARLKTHLNLYHINTSYLRFVPREFIKSLGHDSIIDVGLGDQVHGEMTILFSDIRSFTSITEKLSAKESFELLNEILSYITPSIASHGGFIDKYIGDAIMALFPAKPEDSITSAIQIQQKLTEFNALRQQQNKSAIRIGIGIHTGPLMLGTIGVKDRMDGTVISDAVNLASRLEELNKLYGTSMIVSHSTVQKLTDIENYNYRFLSYARVKGKENAIQVYEFFDGDDEYHKNKKIETLSLFNEGIKEYYEQKFTKASVKFQEVIDAYPEDHTSRTFLKKSAKFMVQGVPDHWDGVDIVEKVF